MAALQPSFRARSASRRILPCLFCVGCAAPPAKVGAWDAYDGRRHSASRAGWMMCAPSLPLCRWHARLVLVTLGCLLLILVVSCLFLVSRWKDAMMRSTLVLLEALLAVGASARPAEIQSPSCKYTAQWPRWENVKYAFIFGDSYTQTGFNYTLTPAPSPSNPLGNPPYPGWTSSNGPNWVDFLTVKHNASLLQTYNLAYGGATVDSALVKPWKDTVLSLKDQVQTQFVPGYVEKKAAAPLPAWHGNNSLFAIWIGINDVGNSFWGGANATKELNAKIFAVYEGLVNTLYDAGARNFAFINVPPIDRSPLTVGQGQQAIDLEKADIASWNGLVGDMANRLKGKRQEVNAWIVDANKVFGTVLDKPASYQATAGLKNTTGFCAAYQNGTPNPDTFDSSCGVPVNQYFWLNDLHPTYPIHDVVALEVARVVASAPNVCPDKPASTTEER